MHSAAGQGEGDDNHDDDNRDDGQPDLDLH